MLFADGRRIIRIVLLRPFDLPSCDKFLGIQPNRPMTKAILFDLERCPGTTNEVGEQLFTLAFAVARVR